MIVIIAVYLLMFLDTNKLMVYAKSVFIGDIPVSETVDKPINEYNIQNHHPEFETVNLEISRLFTIHNFSDGYIWIYYSCGAFDQNGKLIYYSRCPARWKIHKKNGMWEVVKIYEKP